MEREVETALQSRPSQNSFKHHNCNNQGNNGRQSNSGSRRGSTNRGQEGPPRHRLPGISTQDIENARKELRNTSVVNAVVEADRNPHHHHPPKRGNSPSQSSRTESAMGHYGYPKQRLRHDDSDTGSRGSHGSRTSRGSRGSKGNVSLELDQKSDYDNHQPSDMEVNRTSEIDMMALDDEVSNNNNKVIKRIKNSKQSSSEDSDSDSSSSGMGEEQALFQQLTQNPRIVTRKNKFVSEPDLNPLWDGYSAPTYPFHTPNNYAFDSYAIDDYDHSRFFPTIDPQSRFDRKRQSLQERIMLELQDDTDATPV